MSDTFSRKTAAAALNISDVAVGKRLKAITAKYDCSHLILDEQNRITEQGIEILTLWANDRLACESMIESELLEIEAEVITEAAPDTVPAGSLTLATACENIAARTGTIALTSSEQYESRAAAAKSALARFVAANNERGNRLAANAATARRSFEQLGTEHAIGHLMTYAEALNATLAEGMAAMQNGAVSMADQMGKHAAAAE